MKDAEKLEIYDDLRRMRWALNNIKALHAKALEEDDLCQNAITGVDAVLYMAEGVFARMEP